MHFEAHGLIERQFVDHILINLISTEIQPSQLNHDAKPLP